MGICLPICPELMLRKTDHRFLFPYLEAIKTYGVQRICVLVLTILQ